jgi:hypothetical protein
VNLRRQAKLDLSFTLQDGVRGFGLPVIIEQDEKTIGDCVLNPFYGQVSRIQFLIDPDTGQGVNGDFASVVVNLIELKEAGFDVEARTLQRGSFKISAPDVDGTIQSYTDKSFEPDNTLGIARFICSELVRDNSVNEKILTEILETIGVV